MSAKWKVQSAKLIVGVVVAIVWLAGSAATAEDKAGTKDDQASSAPVASPSPASAAPTSSKTMFYRLLARKPAATIEDAIRALAREKGGAQELMPLAEEMSSLDKAGVHFPKDILKRKDATLTMGSAAHMLMKAMEIKGKSVMYKFLPDKQRYALKEAVNLGIIPPNSFLGQTLSGNELLGLLVRIKEINDRQKPAAPEKK